MEILRVSKFGDKKKPAVKILIPHDGSFEEFSHSEPVITETLMNAMEEEESVIRRFMVIEQDLFATKLGELVGKQLIEICDGIHVQVLQVMIPRGVVELNRVKEHAIWNYFDHEEHSHLVKNLHRIYEITFRQIKALLMDAEVLIDLHTMSPTGPWKEMKMSPGKMHEWNENWKNNPSKKRKNDLIGYKEQDGITTPLGDREILQSLQKSFSKAKIPYDVSGTYKLNGVHLGSLWEKTVPSYLNIDITKDNGSKEKPEKKGFDIAELTYDDLKLMHISKAIAEGVGSVLKQRLSESKVLIH